MARLKRRSLDIRAANRDDIPALIDAWYAMLVECDLIESGLVENWRERLQAHFATQMDAGSMAWFVAGDGAALAGTACATLSAGAGFIYKKPIATLSGIYVRPEFRRRGLARALTKAAIEWCGERGCSVIRLVASDAGRPLYESLGFVPGAEMRLRL
jgi:GNAT superfamily N-acetyltransferase